MDKRVLITGGTGFIGRKIVAELIKRGYIVHSIIHSSLLPETEGLVQHKISLADTNKVKEFLAKNKFENFIHFAWYVDKGCHNSDLNLDWTITTLNLLKEFTANGGKKFLGAGTVSEYEYKYGYFLEDETPTNPQTLYGECKNSVYKISKTFCKKYDIEFKWARIFNVYGENERPQRLMPSVINSCLKGEDVKVSTCTKFQDYLYVEDMARGIVDLFESNVQGAVNICSGKPVQLRYIVKKIAELTNFKGKILWGAIPAYFDEPVVVGNNSKLRDEVGFTPKYSLDEGLERTINWWKSQNSEEENV